MWTHTASAIRRPAALRFRQQIAKIVDKLT
jgi:hypothetical protein